MMLSLPAPPMSPPLEYRLPRCLGTTKPHAPEGAALDYNTTARRRRLSSLPCRAVAQVAESVVVLPVLPDIRQVHRHITAPPPPGPPFPGAFLFPHASGSPPQIALSATTAARFDAGAGGSAEQTGPHGGGDCARTCGANVPALAVPPCCSCSRLPAKCDASRALTGCALAGATQQRQPATDSGIPHRFTCEGKSRQHVPVATAVSPVDTLHLRLHLGEPVHAESEALSAG